MRIPNTSDSVDCGEILLKPLQCVCSRPAQLCSALTSGNFSCGPGQYYVRVINLIQRVYFHGCLSRLLHLAKAIY